MSTAATPIAISRAMRTVGEHLTTWRKLRQLTASDLADRAGIGVSTVHRLEAGQGASLENLLRVSRALGVLDAVVTALDPYTTDVGRLRADQALPSRVRNRRDR
jgi:transcriptional regulator with XRE-family HTH domain